MSFAQPWVLTFLFAPLALAVWELLRRGHVVPLPFDHVAPPQKSWLRQLLNMANLAAPLLLACAILLLAGPQRLMVPRQQRVLTNIEFCQDVSGSMTSRYGDGTRYQAAMKAISEFTARRNGDAFGLTIFGNEVLHWTPLTKDVSAINLATPFLQPNTLPSQFNGTEIAKGLRACMKTLLRQTEGDRMIILLTDGESDDLMGSGAMTVANELRAADIVVYAIYIGDGNTPPQLYTIGNVTGGKTFPVTDPAALRAVFQHIDKMRPARLKPSAPQPVEDLRPFAIAGLILLSFHQLALFGWRYNPW